MARRRPLRRGAALSAWLLCASLLAAAVGAAQHIVVGDVSTRDRARPAYDVVLPELGETDGAAGASPPSGEIVRVVTARGQAMLCGVPPPPPPADPAVAVGGGGGGGGAVGVDEFADVDELMDEYRGKCFRREEGWWQYIFCYGLHVEQRHVGSGRDDADVSYILGALDPAFDAERRRGGGARVVGAGAAEGKGAPPVDVDAPYTQLFGNGTVCEVNDGRPREILVKYKCNKDAVQLGGTAGAVAGMEFISALREVETCVYEIDFVNAQICKHPAYRSKLEKNILKINCVMDGGEGAFMGLASSSYRKASLNL
jgi:hypothetical protein